jgi:hypothetical protein
MALGDLVIEYGDNLNIIMGFWCVLPHHKLRQVL